MRLSDRLLPNRSKDIASLDLPPGHDRGARCRWVGRSTRPEHLAPSSGRLCGKGDHRNRNRRVRAQQRRLAECAGTFLAPYRPVAVPHGFGGAGESLAGRHDCGCEKKKCRHSNFLADRSDQSTNFHWCQRPTQQVRQNGDQECMRIPWRGKGLRSSATEHLTAATSVQCSNTIRKN